jgi:hypothetical protein
MSDVTKIVLSAAIILSTFQALKSRAAERPVAADLSELQFSSPARE